MFEYSYFRAEGQAKEVAAAAVQAHHDHNARLYSLKLSFYADRVDYNDPDNYSILYHAAHVVPADLYVSRIDTDAEGKETAVHALPRPGSLAEAKMLEVIDKLEAAHAAQQLEAAFGIADMPAKHLPPGEYETAFVRQRTVKDATQQAGGVPQTGKIEVSSRRGGIVADPLQAMRLDGQYYIRVPNDAEGRALFTPPDSILMDYRDMLALDDVEKALRHGMNPQLAHAGARPLLLTASPR